MATPLYPVTNNARSTLATPGALNNTTDPVTVSVATGEGAAFPTGASFPVCISATLDPTADPDREIAIAVRTGDSFVLTRAGAVAHSGSPYIQRTWTAEDVQQRDVALNAAEDAIAGGINPMTAAESIIKGGTAGAMTELAVGSEGDVLSVVSGAVTWAAPTGGGGSLTLIEEQVLASSAASVTFSTIAGTYRTLVVRFLAASNSSECNLLMRVNGDTGSNYRWSETYGSSTATTVTYSTDADQSSAKVGYLPVATSTNACSGVVELQHYARTTYRKNAIGRFGEQCASAYYQGTCWALWTSTSAVTSLTFLGDGQDLAAGSVFSLYGES